MPRAKKEGAVPKTRSRHGCWPCKAKKIKCDETKPSCEACIRANDTCDYRIRLNWAGRSKRNGEGSPWSSDHITLTPGTPRPFTPQSTHASPAVPFDSGSPASQSLAPPSNAQSRSQASSPATSHSQWPANYDPSMIQGVKRKRDTSESEDASDDRLDTQNGQDDRTPPQSMPRPGLPSPFYNRAALPQTPPTAGHSLAGSETSSNRFASYSSSAYPNAVPGPRLPQDVRRLSVQYLLQSPPDTENSLDSASSSDRAGTSSYGFDQGLPDLDIPSNDDANALTLQSPASATKRLSLVGDDFHIGGQRAEGFGFGINPKDPKFQRADYYARPVPVLIPRSLEPLPKILRQSPINMLYFHHFLNHTAKILVPHDCPENPFKNILPEMAMHNQNLLSLLLAYAASHRSRLLNHRDPVNRIALYVKDVFPSMRNALETGGDAISDANLATAIMLTSLEIISPNAFEVPISWQKHLTIARQMIIARGGFSTLERDGKAAYFLSRWFAYLDVMGSFSGNNYDRPLQYADLPHDSSDPEGDSEIDCLLGFTNRCVRILAKVAELAKQCDGQRIGLGGVVRADWKPSAEVVAQAEALRQALEAARPTAFRRCAHRQPDMTDSAITDSLEMMAINDACHWAGLIHLHRRVLGKNPADEDVQMPVREIAASLDRIRYGGAAEATMIFPMFTAGFEAREPLLRQKLLSRIMSVEAFGMTQVHSAKTLMQKVWSTGRPWETLVQGGELFLG